MDRVYDLIEINMPRKEADYLIFEFETSESILSLGLYNHHNEEQGRIPETAYSQDGSKLKLRPCEVSLQNRDELMLGAKTIEGLSYFKFPKRSTLYLWESYFDYGNSDQSVLNTYAYINIGGKICLINSTKMELDTNVLRIPYIATMKSISLSRRGLSFEFSLNYDKTRFSPDRNKIYPMLSLVDYEMQDFIPVSDFEIKDENDGFKVKGNIRLPADVHLGSYCFAFEVEKGGIKYFLNVFRIEKILFDDIHPYTEDRFATQHYDCEMLWFDREGIILKINGASKKKTTLPFFSSYSFDKKLPVKDQEEWDISYQEFEKEWILRSSYQQF